MHVFNFIYQRFDADGLLSVLVNEPGRNTIADKESDANGPNGSDVHAERIRSIHYTYDGPFSHFEADGDSSHAHRVRDCDVFSRCLPEHTSTSAG
jgi:hypothetical protein